MCLVLHGAFIAKMRIARRGLYHYNCVSVFRIKVTVTYEVC